MPPRFLTNLSAPEPGQVLIELECGHKFQYEERGLVYVAAQCPPGLWLYLNCAHCRAAVPTR